MRVLQCFVLTALSLMTVAPMAHAGNIVLYNTGVTLSGTSLRGAHATDPHYTLTTNSAVGGTMTAYVATVPHTNWVANTSTSQWINPIATDPSTNAVKNVAAGNYDYATTFSLAGFYANTASITGNIAVDDNLLDILINGHSTGQTTAAYGSFHSFSIGNAYSADFLPGINTITFEVHNSLNTTGLQVNNLVGTASVIPEPSAIVPFMIGALGLVTLAAYRRRLLN